MRAVVTTFDFIAALGKMRIPLLPSIMLHRNLEVNKRLWTALVFRDQVGLSRWNLKPTTLCRAAGIATLSSGSSGRTLPDFLLPTSGSLSAAVGSPALRKLVEAGLAEQDHRAQPYELTDKGIDLLVSIWEQVAGDSA